MLLPALTLFLLWHTAPANARWDEEEKIIGGYACIPHSQPWQDALYASRTFHCGGVLLSHPISGSSPQPTHCSYNGNLQAVLGNHNLLRLEASQQSVKVIKEIPYPKYSSKSNNHDLMLLYLEKPVNLTRKIGPIQLTKNCAKPGTRCLVSGWGTTSSPWVRYPSILQCVTVYIKPDQKCRRAYKSGITSGMVCAGDPRGGKDSCQGDSGGLLVCNGVLEGVVSWGIEHCGLPWFSGIYTKLCRYRTWVLDEMRKEGALRNSSLHLQVDLFVPGSVLRDRWPETAAPNP